MGDHHHVPDDFVSFVFGKSASFFWCISRFKREITGRQAFAMISHKWSIASTLNVPSLLKRHIRYHCLFPVGRLSACCGIIATFDSNRRNPTRSRWWNSDNYQLAPCTAGAFGVDDLSHSEQVAQARANLEGYLRVDKKYWFDDFREEVEIMINPDPGDESMASDADWDEWICMDHDPSRDVIETEAALGFPIFERQVRDTLQTFVNSLFFSRTRGRINYKPNLQAFSLGIPRRYGASDVRSCRLQ